MRSGPRGRSPLPRGQADFPREKTYQRRHGPFIPFGSIVVARKKDRFTAKLSLGPKPGKADRTGTTYRDFHFVEAGAPRDNDVDPASWTKRNSASSRFRIKTVNGMELILRLLPVRHTRTFVLHALATPKLHRDRPEAVMKLSFASNWS